MSDEAPRIDDAELVEATRMFVAVARENLGIMEDEVIKDHLLCLTKSTLALRHNTELMLSALAAHNPIAYAIAAAELKRDQAIADYGDEHRN